VSQVKKVLLKVGNLISFCKFTVEDLQLTSILSFWHIYYRIHEWTAKKQSEHRTPSISIDT